MTIRKISGWLVWPALVSAIGFAAPSRAFAHCDGLDGPVVKAARAALDARNPALVLIWVQAEDEAEIRAAFDRTLAVRALSADAKALADRFFYETVVRVHRAGEGAPYTGLAPAGRDLGPAIPVADKALDEGSTEPIVRLLTGTLREQLRERFDEARKAKAFKAGDVPAGREFVRAYVEFIHYVERLYEASRSAAHGHFGETMPAPHDR